MSDNKEKVVEEYNALARALTEIEGATILLALYIIGVFILVFYGKIDSQTFQNMFTSGVIVLTLLKAFNKEQA